MSKEKKVMAVCAERNYTGRTGSPGKCEFCNKNIWISDSTIKAIREGNPDIADKEISLVCVECSLPLMKDSELRMIPPTALQTKEILDTLNNDNLPKTKI